MVCNWKLWFQDYGGKHNPHTPVASTNVWIILVIYAVQSICRDIYQRPGSKIPFNILRIYDLHEMYFQKDLWIHRKLVKELSKYLRCPIWVT